MEKSQFWNQVQFFGSWSLMVVSALWIALEIHLWSKFLLGTKIWFFRAIILLLLIYSVWNGGWIIIGLTQETIFGEPIVINNFTWLSINRMYSHALIPVCFAVMMRVVNYRSATATPEEQNIIYNASVIIMRSREERQRFEEVAIKANEYLHNSK